MGLYLNKDLNGDWLPAVGKADALISEGAIEQKYPHYVHDRLVCVVSNGPFDAAGFMFNQSEYCEFSDPADHRPKRWLEVTPEQIAANFTFEEIEEYRR